MSFGYELGSTSSGHTGRMPSDADSGADSDEIRSADHSEPPSPTAITQAKADAARKRISFGKRRSEEAPRDPGMNAVALGVGLLI